MLRATLAVVLLGSFLFAGCTIERTRTLGEECLQDRECVMPLRCQPNPADNRTLCSAVSEGGLPTPMPRETGAGDATGEGGMPSEAGAAEAGMPEAGATDAASGG